MKTFVSWRAICVTLVIVTTAFDQTAARDLFQVTSITTDVGPALRGTDGASSMVPLLQAAIKAQGPFNAFATRDYTSVLNYANVDKAILFNVASNGTAAEIRIPVTGFRKVFTAPNRSQLYKDIENFLKRDGAVEWARFLAAMNASSPVAVSDGNPNSTTASFASATFNNFGSLNDSPAPGTKSGSNSLGLAFDESSFRAGGFRGQVYQIPITGKCRLTDRVSLGYQIPIQLVTVAGATIYQAGVILDFPWKIIEPSDTQKWEWQLMPTIGLAGGGSPNMVAGGAMIAGSLTSVLSRRIGNVTLTMGNYVGIFEGVDVSIGNYSLDSNIDQQILKNGLRVSLPFARNWLVEAYGICTNFLQSAAVNTYFTVGAELGYHFIYRRGQDEVDLGYLKLGLYGDIGNKSYQSGHIQFGSGWKF